MNGMESYSFSDISITLGKKGAQEYSKVSYPIRYGRFDEIKTPEATYHFDLNGGIKYLQGRGRNWPHPAEWLKRTAGNDWVYYSAGDYKGVFEVTGEYYFPCLSYPSNSVFPEDPFQNEAITSAIQSWTSLPPRLTQLIPRDAPQNIKDFVQCASETDAKTLSSRSRRLHRLIGRRVTVLPPDARHVDYEVIPLMISDGCLYNCGFCCVKSGHDFANRSRDNIVGQIKGLRELYARDLRNYNALFLGEHDALRAGRDIIEFALERAYRVFEFEKSYIKTPRLFLFGSADSLTESKETVFEALNGLPFLTYINIGLESGDPKTLATLRKPLSAETVRLAFARMLDINKAYEKVEVTANFVFGRELPLGHLPSLFALTQGKLDPFSLKGAIYLSPLIGVRGQKEGSKREILRDFKQVKAQSPLPTYIYLIQRL